MEISVAIFNLIWEFSQAYPNLNMAFSVMPRSAVAQADTKIMRPKKTCTGIYELLKCEAKPGNKNVTKPASH